MNHQTREATPVRPEWQGLLRAPLSGESLRFEGTSADGDWVEGRLMSSRGSRIARVTGGIADFVEMPTWSNLDKRPTEERWIEDGGWGKQRAMLKEALFQEICEDILSSGPAIVEVGAGPGGGHMPMVLTRHPSATVLVNDFEYRMLAEWKSFLTPRGLGPGLSFACFDACIMPLASESVDCVSSHGGVSNIKTHRELALREAFRVLRPNGALVALELQLVQPPVDVICDMFKGASEGDAWMLMPGIVTGWSHLAESAGFVVEKDRIAAHKALTEKDGDIGRVAHRFGVAAEGEFHYILARKPA